MGYTVLPPESWVNTMGYNFLQSKMNDKAYAFFKLNIDNYPKSENVFDSMGDFYIVTRDKGKAIDCFRKALSLEANPVTREKLDKLEQKK
jgi:tetratricopeptide (TPR) repeat protein